MSEIVLRMKELKFWLVVAAVVLTATSLLVSHFLVRDLKQQRPEARPFGFHLH